MIVVNFLSRIVNLWLGDYLGNLSEVFGEKKEYHYEKRRDGKFYLRIAFFVVPFLLMVGCQALVTSQFDAAQTQYEEQNRLTEAESKCANNPWAKGCG